MHEYNMVMRVFEYICINFVVVMDVFKLKSYKYVDKVDCNGST